ncbi:MAG: hypothetical protein KatS3mg131_2053 [Candidatus Tectimicrobiota bacterium]|nr:MAG: hypothetical protein KatS3mg131_2053 [Candidatus Tectomicrobia bacterium]
MDREQILRDLAALPPMVQQLVVDFIAFLRLRYAQAPSENREPLPALKDEPFVSMWRDRIDMADSSAWVRTVRTREWN